MKNGYWQLLTLVILAGIVAVGCGSADSGKPATEWQAKAKADPNRGLDGEK